MSDTPPISAPANARAAGAALYSLGIGVALGCLFFGAPPRFGRAHGAGELFAAFLESLGPFFLVQLSIVIAALLLALDTWRRQSVSAPAVGAPRAPWTPLVLLLVLALVSLIPLPPWLLALLAPFSAETYGQLSDPGVWRPLSLWPAGTRNAAWTLAGMLAASIAVLRVVRADRENAAPLRAASRMLQFVLVISVAQCLYGFYETWGADDGYLGLAKLSGKGRVTGTFIHGTMLAVWGGLGACAALGLAAARWSADGARRVPLAVGLVLLSLLALAGAQFSLSRLGLLAAGVAVMFVLVRLARALRAAGATLTARLCVASAVAAPLLGVATVLAVPRFRERIHYVTDWLQGIDVPEEPRWAMWTSTWDLITRAPLQGTGIGSFGRAVHLVQGSDVPQELWFAHSDLLNLLSDAGVIGVGLGLWWIVGLWWGGLRAVNAGPSAARCLATGALGGALVVLIAALGDFQTQFPVVAIPFAALFTLPLALVAPAPAETGYADPSDRSRATLRTVALVALILTAAYFAVHEQLGRLRHRSAGRAPAATPAERTLLAGRAALESRDPARLPEALAALEDAADADPLLDRAHLWRAVALLQNGRQDEGLAHLGRARWVSRGHADVNLLIGQLYLRLIDTAPAPHGPPNDDALEALREAGALSPQAFAAAFQLGLQVRLDADTLRRLVPDRAHAWITFAEQLQRDAAAPAEIRTALEQAVAVEPRHAVARLRLARDLLAGNRLDDARLHALRALELEPASAAFHRELARAYEDTQHSVAGRAVFDAAGIPYLGAGD